MTLNEITYDLLRLLTHNKAGEDSRLNINNLQYKIHQYRAKKIEEIYRYTKEIDPIWIQNMGTMSVSKIKGDEDALIQYGYENYGLINIPTVIRFPNDLGAYRVAGTDMRCQYFPISEHRFFSLIPESTRANHKYYFRLGNKLYLTPYIKEANIQLILTNPLDGYILDRSQQLTLTDGVEYMVKGTSGTVTVLTDTGSDVHAIGDTFTATDLTYTAIGDAKVYYNGYKRSLTEYDTYPLDGSFVDIMLKEIVQEINFELQMMPDNKNNQQDDTNKRTIM